MLVALVWAFWPRHELFSLLLFLYITGETSAGKSSLINLLLNEKVIPIGVLQTTLTICEISYGAKKEAVIHFAKPGKAHVRLEEKKFDRLQEYITKPLDNELHCKKIEIKIRNALLKVQT